MADEIEFKTKYCKLKQLCCICRGYLSCAPILVLPDESYICGRCSAPTDAMPYRAVILEAMLKDTEFPCKYEQYGCTSLLLFGHTAEHEAKCSHHPEACATVPYLACTWQGSTTQILDHLAEKHSDITCWDAKIALQVNENSEDIAIAMRHVGAYIVKYEYECTGNKLKYLINSVILDLGDQLCKIKIANHLQPEYVVRTKGSRCGNNEVLNVANLFPVLNNPKVITVAFQLTFPDTVKYDSVNYELLNSMKCGRCEQYLAPPLFDYEEKKICSVCSNAVANCQPSADKDLELRLAKEKYPCRWEGCTDVVNGDSVRSHETKCTFRLYQCVFPKCKASFKFNTAVEHFQNHDCEPGHDRFEYSVCFSDSRKVKNMFTVIDNEIVLVRQYMQYCNRYVVDLKTTSPTSFVSMTVTFRGSCKCESNDFKTDDKQTLSLGARDLPSCFKDSVLKATVLISKVH